jgi:hypothetical protein
MRAAQTLAWRPLRRPAAMRVAAVLAGGTAIAGLLLVPASAATSRPAAPTSLSVVTSGPGHYLAWHRAAATTFVIQQATNGRFTQGVRHYTMRAPSHVFTPYDLVRGTTYYFRVRAVINGSTSAPSNRVSFTETGAASTVRVAAYNSLSATFDKSPDNQHPGGIAAPFSQRRDPQLALLSGNHPDVIGVEEGAACLHSVPHTTCYRQIDSLADGLGSNYTLADTYTTNGSTNRYTSNYIIFGKTVTPLAKGGSWVITPSSGGVNPAYAAYQAFRVVSSRAKFLFVDTHLASARSSSADQARGIETENMLRQAKAYAARLGVTSIIYVGDFNSYVGAWQVNDITGKDMRAAGIPDGIAVAQHRVRAKYDSINSIFRTARNGHGSADHIYATGGVGVKTWGELLNLDRGQFVGVIPSDHNPIYAVVTLPY